MRISTLGSFAAGFNAAAGEFTIDGAVLLPAVVTANKSSDQGIGPAWLSTLDAVIFEDGVGLVSYDTVSTARTTLLAGNLNHFGAGAGNWATWTAGVGVHSNIPGATVLSTNYLGDVDTITGDLVTIETPDDGGRLTIRNAAGALVWDSNEHVSFFRVHSREGYTAYQQGTAWKLVVSNGGAAAIYAPQLDQAVNWLTPALLGDDLYVLERTFDTAGASDVLTVRLATSNQVWEIDSWPNLLNPDIIGLDSTGVLRIGYSYLSGEIPSNVAIVELKPSNSTIRRGSISTGAVVWGAWEVLKQETIAIGPVGGGGLSSKVQFPPETIAVVDKAGHISKPHLAWANAIQSVTDGLVTVVNNIPPVPPQEAFTTVASPGAVSLTAGTNPVLTITVSGDLDVTLDPATNTVAIRARNSVPPGLHGDDGSDGRDGRDGKDGRDGQDGRHGQDGEDGAQGLMGPSGAPIGLAISTVRVTDAEIKAWPTTPITLIAAPPISYRLVPIQTQMAIQLPVAYTNISSSSSVNVGYLGASIWSNFLVNDPASTPDPLTDLTSFLTLTPNNTATFTAYTFEADEPFYWGNLVSILHGDQGNFPLGVTFDNGSDGDLTGGDPGNYLVISTLYYVMPLA